VGIYGNKKLDYNALSKLNDLVNLEDIWFDWYKYSYKLTISALIKAKELFPEFSIVYTEKESHDKIIEIDNPTIFMRFYDTKLRIKWKKLVHYFRSRVQSFRLFKQFIFLNVIFCWDMLKIFEVEVIQDDQEDIWELCPDTGGAYFALITMDQIKYVRLGDYNNSLADYSEIPDTQTMIVDLWVDHFSKKCEILEFAEKALIESLPFQTLSFNLTISFDDILSFPFITRFFDLNIPFLRFTCRKFDETKESREDSKRIIDAIAGIKGLKVAELVMGEQKVVLRGRMHRLRDVLSGMILGNGCDRCQDIADFVEV
jgi:hypothetical protein